MTRERLVWIYLVCHFSAYNAKVVCINVTFFVVKKCIKW